MAEPLRRRGTENGNVKGILARRRWDAENGKNRAEPQRHRGTEKVPGKGTSTPPLSSKGSFDSATIGSFDCGTKRLCRAQDERVGWLRMCGREGCKAPSPYRARFTNALPGQSRELST